MQSQTSMEPNSSATSDSEAQGASSDHQVGVDRFSAVPFEIAHHILSFLPISDVTRVGSLSKRCRRFHLSTPTLNFTEFPPNSTQTFASRLELLHSLDGFFINREDNKIQSFCTNWVFQYHSGGIEIERSCVEKARVIAWIDNAVRCNVEDLTLIFRATPMILLEEYLLTNILELSSFVFVCESLRSLFLDIKGVIVKAPTNCSTSNLVSLKLKNVTLNDEGFFSWVSGSCRFIKELWLESIHLLLHNITIESSSLKSFRLELPCRSFHGFQLKISGENLQDLHLHWEFGSPNGNLLNILAPNLKHLKWVGNIMNQQHLGEFNCLEEAEISLLAIEVNDLDRKLDQFLSTICSVKVLVVDLGPTKALFREAFTPAPLYNVSYLRISVLWGCIDDSIVPSMVSLFRGLPNLNALDLKLDHMLHFPQPEIHASGFDMGYWEQQGLAFISQLKEVTIDLSSGSNGMEFARYILEHAQNLKKMVVNYLSNQSNMAMELRGSRIISNASVVFLEKEERRRF